MSGHAHFLDGPAEDVSLALDRFPLWLRVTHADGRPPVHGFDALDQIDDEAQENEEIHVYRRGMHGFACNRGVRLGQSGIRFGEHWATYRYVQIPDPERARDNEEWRKLAAELEDEASKAPF